MANGGGRIVDRDAFLARISAAVMATDLPPAPAVPDQLADLEPADHVALFRERAIDVDAVVHGPVTRHGVARAVTGIAAGHQCETFMSWDDLPAVGVSAALSSAGLNRVDAELPEEGRKEHQLGFSNVDLGVTGADLGLAESGTVVLSHGQGRQRMTSLIPDIHIALLEVSSIERSLAHWANRHPDMARETTNLIMVTGPSRTGDIGQHLNLGVHGPRHVHVVLVK